MFIKNTFVIFRYGIWADNSDEDEDSNFERHSPEFGQTKQTEIKNKYDPLEKFLKKPMVKESKTMKQSNSKNILEKKIEKNVHQL